MEIKKIIKIIYALSLTLVIIFLISSTFNSLHFQRHAIRTEALVVSVEKKWVTYAVDIRFRTKYKTELETTVSIYKKLEKGQPVALLYNPLIPAYVRPDYFLAVWSESMALLLILMVLLFLMYSVSFSINWKRNSHKKLKQAGNHIYTRFKSVEAVTKVRKDGKHPYQIISSWEDLREKKTYFFKSEYIWHNPLDYIMGETITVMIDKKNKKKYLMDLGFLPESMRSKKGT